MENLNKEQIIKALEHCGDDRACGKCEWHELGNGCIATLCKNALAIIKELTEENERLRAEWISVKDRLPDNHRAVLVVCKSTSISGGAIRAVGSYGGGFWSLADADGTLLLTKYMQYTVTHWMELPDLPKGE